MSTEFTSGQSDALAQVNNQILHAETSAACSPSSHLTHGGLMHGDKMTHPRFCVSFILLSLASRLNLV